MRFDLAGSPSDRRRTAFRVGLFLICLVSFALLATACIFDQGDYKGGGRIGRAATAQQDKVTSSSSGSGDDDDDTTSTTSTSTTTSTVPNLDAGLGGGS